METMASYILTVLKSSGFIFLSWGSHNFRALSNDKGLSFTVNGFVYQGEVSVVYNAGSDTFYVTIGENTYKNIYVDMLSEFIDEKVEKNGSKESYEQQVESWFGSEE
jgi:hypothetical protein